MQRRNKTGGQVSARSRASKFVSCIQIVAPGSRLLNGSSGGFSAAFALLSGSTHGNTTMSVEPQPIGLPQESFGRRSTSREAHGRRQSGLRSPRVSSRSCGRHSRQQIPSDQPLLSIRADRVSADHRRPEAVDGLFLRPLQRRGKARRQGFRHGWIRVLHRGSHATHLTLYGSMENKLGTRITPCRFGVHARRPDPPRLRGAARRDRQDRGWRPRAARGSCRLGSPSWMG